MAQAAPGVVEKGVRSVKLSTESGRVKAVLAGVGLFVQAVEWEARASLTSGMRGGSGHPRASDRLEIEVEKGNQTANSFMLREAGVASLANALINGWASWSKFAGKDRLSLTVDSISGGSGSVLGQAIGGVFIMALAVTGVTFYTFRRAARNHGVALQEGLQFWPRFPVLMLKNALFLFGLLVVLAIMLHRWLGEIAVDRMAATLVVAGLAVVVTLYSALTSMSEMVAKKSS